MPTTAATVIAAPPPVSELRLVFDRGTVILLGLDRARGHSMGADRIPGLLWDERVEAYRAPAHRHHGLGLALRALGLLTADPAPPTWREVRAARPALRPYQKDALAAWQRAGRRGIVALPTGSGKTRIGQAALAEVGQSTMVLCPTRVLLGQWVACLRRSYSGPIGVLGDGTRTVEQVTVATFESAFLHADAIGDRFGLLIVDEVHHLGSGARAEALEMCTAPWRMGLTATPPEGPEALARLGELVGQVVWRQSISELSGRYLAPFDCIRLHVELRPEERDAYRRKRALFEEHYQRFRRQRKAASWSEFVVACVASREGRRALAGFHEARRVVAMAEAKLRLAEELLLRHRQEPALVFTAENRAAYALSRRLLMPALTCDIGRPERERVLQALRAGQLRAVVSARVLNEGIDLPSVRVGMILGGTLGGREHVQRVGRLLRPLEGKRALIYEVVVDGTFEVGQAAGRQRYLVS